MNQHSIAGLITILVIFGGLGTFVYKTEKEFEQERIEQVAYEEKMKKWKCKVKQDNRESLKGFECKLRPHDDMYLVTFRDGSKLLVHWSRVKMRTNPESEFRKMLLTPYKEKE
jgi:hypothetical protein